MARAVTAAHRAVYRLSGGRVGGRVAGTPVLLLTTRGRRSGQPRTTALGYVEDGDRLVVIGSYGGDPRHPDWYRNLCADPDVQVTRGSSTRAMTARTATAAERERLWPEVVAAHPYYDRYQKRTTREIPLVILTPR